MAPAVVQAVAGSAAKDFKNESAAARLLGSGRDHIHSCLDLVTESIRLCWYRRTRHLPSSKLRKFTGDSVLLNVEQVDTIAKRLMSNQGRVIITQPDMRLRLIMPDNIRIWAQCCHLQRICERIDTEKIHFVISWVRLCRRLQGGIP